MNMHYVHTELEMDATGFEARYNDLLFRKTIVEYLNETEFLGLTVSLLSQLLTIHLVA